MSNNNGQKLAGKVAVVTGGSRGIGAAIARRLATDGASVAITYTKGADAAASVIKEIERAGGKAIAIQADAAGDWAVPQKAGAALNRYGHVDDIAAMVAFVAGPEASYVTVREPDSRWRNERLTNDRICIETTIERRQHQ
jgi:NAD(P)-dependent dehydrogenase (short-subunit alcohol dehydrogenase family)